MTDAYHSRARMRTAVEDALARMDRLGIGGDTKSYASPKVGDRVKVKPGKQHDDMTKEATGTVVEISTDALGIKFDDMKKVHHWYVASEVEPVEAKGIGRAYKSIGEVSREYRDLLENLVVAAANGTVSSGSLASQMREAIIDEGRAVYLEGMREGGSDDPEADLDDTDESAIGEWQTGQAGFINGFRDDALAVHDLSGDARTAARDVMLGRVDDWVNALEGLGRLGTANMKRNTYGTWKVGDTEHCETCNSLNGKRKRLKWFIDNGYIPGEPGSETLDCHGYNCQCQIVDDEGTRIL